MASTHRLPAHRQRDEIESATIRRGDLHADIRVWTVDQYREAMSEVEALEEAPEGSPGFRRRQQLMTDIFHYEQHFDKPKFNRALPDKDGGK